MYLYYDELSDDAKKLYQSKLESCGMDFTLDLGQIEFGTIYLAWCLEVTFFNILYANIVCNIYYKKQTSAHL